MADHISGLGPLCWHYISELCRFYSHSCLTINSNSFVHEQMVCRKELLHLLRIFEKVFFLRSEQACSFFNPVENVLDGADYNT
jgi:hypothetical protein